MSRENVDFVRGASWQGSTGHPWGRGLRRGTATEDFVVEDFPELPRSHATYEGPGEHAGDRSALSRDVGRVRFQEPVEFIDAGDDLVIAVGRYAW